MDEGSVVFFNLKAEVISCLSNYKKSIKTMKFMKMCTVTLDFKQNEHYSHF